MDDHLHSCGVDYEDNNREVFDDDLLLQTEHTGCVSRAHASTSLNCCCSHACGAHTDSVAAAAVL